MLLYLKPHFYIKESVYLNSDVAKMSSKKVTPINNYTKINESVYFPNPWQL